MLRGVSLTGGVFCSLVEAIVTLMFAEVLGEVVVGSEGVAMSARIVLELAVRPFSRSRRFSGWVGSDTEGNGVRPDDVEWYR